MRPRACGVDTFAISRVRTCGFARERGCEGAELHATCVVYALTMNVVRVHTCRFVRHVRRCVARFTMAECVWKRSFDDVAEKLRALYGVYTVGKHVDVDCIFRIYRASGSEPLAIQPTARVRSLCGSHTERASLVRRLQRSHLAHYRRSCNRLALEFLRHQPSCEQMQHVDIALNTRRLLRSAVATVKKCLCRSHFVPWIAQATNERRDGLRAVRACQRADIVNGFWPSLWIAGLSRFPQVNRV